ncbi:DUF4232 domain-containing protein [Nocardia sp. NPDC059239]|uniref:DUF4232 domain-containing protein n=1 Tax=unclassified Nocardia TaxID=2637762 RepID=UPI0036B1ECB5
MKRNTAGVAVLAGVLVAVTAGCTANGNGSLTVSPGPATVSSSVPTGGPTGSGGTPAPSGAPASPGSGGSPDSGGGQPSGGGSPVAGDGSTGTTAPTPTVAPIAECTNGQIHVRAENLAALNQNYAGTALIFETTGDTSCWMVGYPGVDMWAPGNNWVHARRSLYSAVYGQNPDHSFLTPQQVTIKPGQPAHAIVESTTTDNGRPCPVSHTLNVTPPDMTATQPVETGSMYPCSVVIHPITP